MLIGVGGVGTLCGKEVSIRTISRIEKLDNYRRNFMNQCFEAS